LNSLWRRRVWVSRLGGIAQRVDFNGTHWRRLSELNMRL
jgi:hypothetical protein